MRNPWQIERILNKISDSKAISEIKKAKSSKHYITCNEGWRSADMDLEAANRYAYLLLQLGNVNVRVHPVKEMAA